MKARWLVGVSLISAMGSLASACAQGSSYEGSGGDGSGQGGGWSTSSASTSDSSSSTSASVGSGGAGGSMTTSSSTTTSASSTTGSGGACQGNPCKLVAPQCGCAAGEGCTLDNTGAPTCDVAGNVAPGGNCSADACQPGSICLGTTPTTPTCGEFCATDAQCTAPGGLCVVKLNDGSGNEIPGVTLCSENCDPTTNVGCVSGTGCTFGQEQAGQMRFFTACRESGAKTQGQTCTTNAECAPGYGCINTGTTQCMKYCKVGTTCANGMSCSAVSIGGVDIVIGGIQYGICP